MSVIRNEEKQKLARVINDAIDAASLKAGLLKPTDIKPYNEQPDEIQLVILEAAGQVYDSMVYDKAVGEIRVIPGGHSF
jgi:hypothetical protein